MNLSSVNQNDFPNSPTPSQDTDTKIRSLEQKLQKLKTAKQKAVQSKDEVQKENLEKQIQKVQKQIQQLRNRETNKSQRAESAPLSPKEAAEKLPAASRYIDILA